MSRSTDTLVATLVSAGIAIGAVQSAPSAANAQGAKLVAGTLTCKGEASIGLILGSNQQLSCRFKSAGGGASAAYDATITKIGLDIGFKTESVVVWSVLGSTTTLAPGSLSGSYVGVSAETSVALGVGANALVGGSDESIVLQPLSIQGQTGLNLAVGVTGLTLRR